MIVATIEWWPKGKQSKKSRMGRITVKGGEETTGDTGQYVATIQDAENVVVGEITVKDFPLAFGALRLVEKVLTCFNDEVRLETLRQVQAAEPLVQIELEKPQCVN